MHRLAAVTEQAGRVVSDKVQVFVAIQVREAGFFPADEGNGEWRVVQGLPRVAPGQDVAGTQVPRMTQRIYSGEAPLGWRYRRVATLGRADTITSLVAPDASISVTDLLP